MKVGLHLVLIAIAVLFAGAGLCLLTERAACAKYSVPERAHD